jgi:hypothetical protein
LRLFSLICYRIHGPASCTALVVQRFDRNSEATLTFGLLAPSPPIASSISPILQHHICRLTCVRLVKRIPERRTRSAGQLFGAGIRKDAKSEESAHHPWTVPHIHSLDLPNLVPTADKLVFLPEHPPSHMSLSNFATHVSSPTFHVSLSIFPSS